MTDNGPNTAHDAQEVLIERARVAGKIVSPFFQGDLDKLHEAVKRVDDMPYKPARIEYHLLRMTPGTIFPRLDSRGEARLALHYADLAEINVVHSVYRYDEPFNDTLIPEYDEFKDYSLSYSTQHGNLTVKMSADFQGSFFFNGSEMKDPELTDEAVVLFEELADRIRPILAEVSVLS